jgi:hypothetical protein
LLLFLSLQWRSVDGSDATNWCDYNLTKLTTDNKALRGAKLLNQGWRSDDYLTTKITTTRKALRGAQLFKQGWWPPSDVAAIAMAISSIYTLHSEGIIFTW